MMNLLNIHKEVWYYLRQKPSSRYTKMEAFWDLLDRCTEEPYIYNRYNTQVEIKRGQFVSTFIDLASVWGWHRPTVTKFINDLVRLGVVEYTKHYSSIIFSFKGYGSMYPEVHNKQTVLLELQKQVESFFDDKISSEDLLRFCETFSVNYVQHFQASEGCSEGPKAYLSNENILSSLTFRLLVTCLRKHFHFLIFDSLFREHNLMSQNISIKDFADKCKSALHFFYKDWEEGDSTKFGEIALQLCHKYVDVLNSIMKTEGKVDGQQTEHSKVRETKISPNFDVSHSNPGSTPSLALKPEKSQISNEERQF